jgi:hypothetical protein
MTFSAGLRWHSNLKPGRQMSNAPPQPEKVSGLTKIEAEDLLDQLEASGCEPYKLSFVDGEGFSVRPEATVTKDSTPMVSPQT